jgi:pimeloyl-ACP methyl ester carboxylesterase
MSEPKTSTLEVPGAVLHYDLRDNGGAGHPGLLLIGSPMGASGFAALAEQFTDRTVVTYDPRGTERSRRTDGEPPGSAPNDHAGDLRLVIQALDAGPADVFGSNGGAVNALALLDRWGLVEVRVLRGRRRSGSGCRGSVGALLSSAAGGQDSVGWLLLPGRQRGMVAAGSGGEPRQRGSPAAVRAHDQLRLTEMDVDTPCLARNSRSTI